jgi:hypothetical protein
MRSKSSKSETVIDLNRPHTCEFCKKSFAQERTLISHVCETKRRHQLKSDPQVRAAYETYAHMYQVLHPTRKGMSPTYPEFVSSSLWSTLVKFHHWCQEQLVQEPAAFVSWLLNQNVPPHAWCDRIRYDEFLKHLLMSEPALQALNRSLRVIHDWHLNTQRPYSEFFEHNNCNLITSWIQQGRISAWLLYNSVTAEKYFVRCTPEQLNLIQQIAPITSWKVKFLRNQTECDEIRLTLSEAGL